MSGKTLSFRVLERVPQPSGKEPLWWVRDEACASRRKERSRSDPGITFAECYSLAFACAGAAISPHNACFAAHTFAHLIAPNAARLAIAPSSLRCSGRRFLNSCSTPIIPTTSSPDFMGMKKTLALDRVWVPAPALSPCVKAHSATAIS